MITYLIEVSICWLLFYIIYVLLLSKETFFNINRWYLLSMLGSGLVIPLFTVDFTTLFFQAPNSGVVYLAEGFSELELVIEGSVEQAQRTEYSWLTLIKIIYVLGFLVTFMKFLHGFKQIHNLYQEGIVHKRGEYNLVLTKTPHLPFSFFNYLFWHKDTALEDKDSGKIITHELAHINQWHSLDVLFLELLGIIFWFSPPIYWYKKSLRTIHEYLADAYVLRNTKKKQYGHLLIRQVRSGMQISLANNFIHSQLKQRINMMMRNKSGRKELMRYLPALPLLLLMVLVFSNKNVKENFKETTAKAGFIFEENLENNNSTNPITTIDSLPNNISSTSSSGEKVYKVVDKMPLFPGCNQEEGYSEELRNCANQKMLEFVYQNIKYPAVARKAGLEGTVVIRFLVKKDGRIDDAEVLRNIGGGAGEEALRVVNLMKEQNIKWVPGQQDEKAVTVNFNLPIKFKLEKNDVRQGEMTKEFEDKIILKDGEIYTGKDKDISKTDLPEIHLARKKDIVAEEKTSDGSSIYKLVQQMPLFPGCSEIGNYSEELRNCANQKMLEFIYENVKYPELARKEGVEGVVVIRFIVKKDGGIDDVKVVRNVGSGIDEEALRVVQLMKKENIKWMPGKQDGKAVNVYFNLPIKFKLADDLKEEIAKNKATENNSVPSKDLLQRGSADDNVKLNLGGQIITLNAFPNPTREKLTITLEGATKNILLTVFDINGKEYLRDKLEKFSGTYYKTINLDNAPKGTLIVNIRHKGKDYQKKVIVQ